MSYDKARYLDSKRRGICVNCHKRKAIPDHIRCGPCHERQRDADYRFRKGYAKRKPPVTITEAYAHSPKSPCFIVSWKGDRFRFYYRTPKQRKDALADALGFRLALLHELFPFISPLIKPVVKQSNTLHKFYNSK